MTGTNINRVSKKTKLETHDPRLITPRKLRPYTFVCACVSLCQACEWVVTLSLCHEQSGISYISDTDRMTYRFMAQRGGQTFHAAARFANNTQVNSNFKLFRIHRNNVLLDHAYVAWWIYSQRYIHQLFPPSPHDRILSSNTIYELHVNAFTQQLDKLWSVAASKLHLLSVLPWYYSQLVQHHPMICSAHSFWQYSSQQTCCHVATVNLAWPDGSISYMLLSLFPCCIYMTLNALLDQICKQYHCDIVATVT